ncbi:RNA binding motif protein 11 [Alosa sapidissima]|uniref:RNA binding motif protein 11 n=1 Tax=Alosa sapidissima TaxID=34773 RepID=UPI001C08EE1B|nr:RNA binding motif protein 11 [Alosa sapidissima]
MAMPGDANKTVFVGNLDPLVKEEILYELFLQAGPVRKVTMVVEGRRRPFGFVLYKHAEAVPYAIALLNGISLYGRPLKLNFSTGSSQDPWGSFGSPGSEDRGPNIVRRGVYPQDSPIFNFSGFTPHGDCRSQDQITRGNAVCNWTPCQLTPLPHQVAPNPFAGLFSSTSPLPPWRGPFWTPPLTPLPPPAPPAQEREEAPPPPKEREMERERDREKPPVSVQERERDREKPPVSVQERERGRERLPVPLNPKAQEVEREKEVKRRKHKRMRSRKHRHQSRHNTNT